MSIVILDEDKQTELCRLCDNYAGDGMYCTKNMIVYDFSRSCKWWDEKIDGVLGRPSEPPKRKMTEEHKKNISDAMKRKWADRKEDE